MKQNPIDIIIRKAVQKDLPEILDLFRHTIEQVCSNDYNPEQITAWTSSANNPDKWLKRLHEQFFIIAVHNEKIVGFASLAQGNYIDVFYVHTDFQRHGIAGRLFQELIRSYLRSGKQSLKSDVSITARPFFERMGFEVVKENKNEIQGTELINYHMVLNNGRIVFFDGICGLCNGLVDFLMKADKNDQLRFAALQGKTAQKLLSSKQTTDLDTIVYWKYGRLSFRSNAVINILREVGGIYRMAFILKIIPNFLRDIIYNFIAQKRYKWFTKRQVCRMPTDDERNKIMP